MRLDHLLSKEDGEGKPAGLGRGRGRNRKSDRRSDSEGDWKALFNLEGTHPGKGTGGCSSACEHTPPYEGLGLPLCAFFKMPFGILKIEQQLA